MKTSLLSLKSLSQRARRWEINLHNKINQQHLRQPHLSRLSSPRRLLSVDGEWIFMRRTFCATLPSSTNLMINCRPTIQSGRSPPKSKPLVLTSSSWRTSQAQMVCNHGGLVDGPMTPSSMNFSLVRLKTFRESRAWIFGSTSCAWTVFDIYL